MMTGIGIAIIILTFYAIIKNFETRLALILGGLAMGIVGGNPLSVIDAFSTALVNKTLTPVICVTMGFGLILKYTGCSTHIVNLAAKGLKKTGIFLLPLTIIVMWLLNISLVSASGLAAAVGVILVPVLIRVGIHPVMAGTAVLLGTWGSSVSPASALVVQVGEIAGQDTMVGVMRFLAPGTLAMIASAIAFSILACFWRNKQVDNNVEADFKAEQQDSYPEEPINLFKAFIPLVPILILVLGSPMVKVIPNISIVNAMLVGTVLAYISYRKDIKDFMKEFFKGMGEGFVDIIILMGAAAVFIQGMIVIGIVDAMITALKGSGNIAAIASVAGPMIVAVLSGSGNAATLAFNGSVTPFAEHFGLNMVDMGMVAQAAGNIGRTMSPVAGVTIICAKIAGVSPMEVAKYAALPCIVAALTMLVLVYYI